MAELEDTPIITGMETNEIIQLIQSELPRLFRENEPVRHLVLEITQGKFADKAQTEDRFERMLAELQHSHQELRTLREEQNRKWEEQNRKWEEQNRKWEENQQELRTLREEQNRKWEEQNRKWEEQNRKWEEQNQKWKENQQTINQMLQSIKGVNNKIDSSIGALGARWGIKSETSFRKALKGILEDSFAVTVENVTEFDEAGEVFGRPDQIELDIIIKNGLLIICEIKSSMSKSDMFLFIKKIAFYEKRHQTKATRQVVISPMVDSYAADMAQEYGLEVYSSPQNMAGL